MKASRILPKVKGAQFYKIGEKVEAIKEESGAWFSADIIDILPSSKCDCEDDCDCTYKLLFEGNDNSKMEVVDRKLDEIRQVSYLSIDWSKLEVGMRVVVNYNIDKPKQWGLWYDYIIENIEKRNDVFYLDGTLLVGYDGSSMKLPVKLNSDNVADVLEIRPHATLKEKEMVDYETGVKPEYCKKCKNKPKVKCRKCCCCKCGSKKDFELTVQCDECDDWYHIYCLVPPLHSLPSDEDWYCPKCSNETHRKKLEQKLKLKKQRQEEKKAPKNQGGVRYTDDSKPPSKKQKSIQSQKPGNVFKADVEIVEVMKTLPVNKRIWKEVENQYADREILKIIVEMSRKRDSTDEMGEDLDKLISDDTENAHLWREARQSLPMGKQAFLEACKKIFTCPICCELLKDPITLSCKHSFCIDCFFRALTVNVYSCSVCRVHITNTQHYVVNENMKKALAFIFKKKCSQKNTC